MVAWLLCILCMGSCGSLATTYNSIYILKSSGKMAETVIIDFLKYIFITTPSWNLPATFETRIRLCSYWPSDMESSSSNTRYGVLIAKYICFAEQTRGN